MQRYLYEYVPPRSSVWRLSPAGTRQRRQQSQRHVPQTHFSAGNAYEKAAMVSESAESVRCGALCRRAAAVVLTRTDLLPRGSPSPVVRISGSSVVIDTLALHDRPDPLAFQAARYLGRARLP
jgi:acetyl-CoA C-acetyltransferase